MIDPRILQLLPLLPPRVRELVEQKAASDRSFVFALHAVINEADDAGVAALDRVSLRYRDDHLHALRAEGRDADHEAGRLGLDEVRQHLSASVLPRLAAEGLVRLGMEPVSHNVSRISVAPQLWTEIAPQRRQIADVLRQTGEHAVRTPRVSGEAPAVAQGSVLEAEHLTKEYRHRKVVNDVHVRLQQGEIVGLLGPNGAGKTTTFYMIVGLIDPLEGRITIDGEDITKMPMYKRARRGIGYLSQEPSIFRKLTVEDNILAILETLSLSASEREARLEQLLDELSIKHLRRHKAYSLSGGERRRLEITRALVTHPKFMMLDEPFAGVDPIAVHDIQQIVAGLRHRGIGVLISDHNVEQTLDIVDRAYIMFDGQVKVSGTVRQLVYDDTVAEIYLGPTLTARLRTRFAAEGQVA